MVAALLQSLAENVGLAVAPDALAISDYVIRVDQSS